MENTSVASIEAQVEPYNKQIEQLDADLERINTQANEYEQRITNLQIDTSAIESVKSRVAAIEENIVVVTNKLQSRERDKIKEGQAVIGVTSDGLFGSNTTRAYNAWLEAQRARISELQAQETGLRTQAQSTLDAERDRLTEQVKDLRGEQTNNILQRKQSLLDAIDSIRSGAVDEAKTQRATIQSKIDTILDTDIPANRSARQTAQEQITALRQADDARINAARQSIKDLRAGAEAQIAASNDLIQRLRNSLTVGKDADVEAIIDAQQKKIVEFNNTIDSLTEDKYTLQAEYRKLEAEVGPIKYLAEFVYGETNQDILEEAVRWVIIVIIFVFDPLAVLLLIASQATFEMRSRSPKKDDFADYERARAQRILDNPGWPPEDNNNDNQSNDNINDEHTQSGSENRPNENQSTDDTETSGASETNVHSGEDEADITVDRTPDNGGDSSEGLAERELTEEEKKRAEEIAELEETEAFKEAKKAWKVDHPEQRIKYWKDQYIKGKVTTLPWSEYVQNDEQDENSLWNKIGKNE
jgi:hypothetical protein